ncbi:Divalent-cation tolerance protein CutA [Acaryochloris thomasi RCC1774]|uniref:Divalent-cation tolerance protein CutA n=1 Tax=Acaryochloris thomasi RCC1774 TaxID=1764569 RepID=A0A2W1JSI6_9CYAN|nr:divalent-cation tolerance protein CutA [Acaryochloris thomasi]PZD71697.1 Divalent-cation tolerance protein CutA [Acaryochloris thomasi RCC1774]
MAHADLDASNYGLVLVTAPSREVADAIATPLVQEKLAACISLMPVTSIYTWDNQLQKDEEWQLLIKTELSHFPDLETRILALHPYDIPEIIAVPLSAGTQPYLSWITAQVKPVS